ncbi:hypothetical protein IQ235_16560 [Oscillatoriales cyanobacterium LEGE 11467]|uniref:Uncharacterized protein n=1 Tax=Zarconia navalis LEGE 11467 TaxID=1828826 RepID=A0A928VY81_9CYAN|nr:hypothetical protein [Zarconia navalis]MBE9042387.1 hypothetical protein [Zarconia navalis LEGE 11467]
MKPTQLAIATLTLLSPLFLGAGSVFAQTEIESTESIESSEVWIVSDAIELNRAKNYARQAAARFNGGLENYRAEPAMHGPSSEAPFIINEDGSWTFTFLGGRPGSDVFSVETAVTVSPDGEFINIDYNQPL